MEGTKLSSDVTLFAKWTANTYTVTFDKSDGVFTGDVEVTRNVTFGEPYGELPVVAKEGFIFAGWFTDRESGSEVTAETLVNIAKDHTLYAVFIEGKALRAPFVTDSEGNRYESGAELEKGTKLYLTSDNNNAAIYFTTNEIEKTAIPEDDAHLYKEAITLNSDVIIFAKAVKEGSTSSIVASYSFTVKNEAEDWGDIEEADKAEYASPSEVPSGIWAAGLSAKEFAADYTGSEITIDDLHVYCGKTRLVLGEDYTIKYSNNVNASTATKKASVLITGIGNYAGTRKIDFVVNALNLGDGSENSENLDVADIQAEDTGKIIKGTTTVVYRLNGTDVVLKNGTDFTYDYSNVQAKPGDYKVFIRGKGNYTGTAVFTQTVYAKKTKTNISKLTFNKISAQTADGSPKEPEIIITDKVTDKKNPYVLIQGEDFEVEYLNNTAAGMATAVVTGKGDKYAGTKTLTFKINGIALSKAMINIEDMTYTGTEQLPTYWLTYQAYKKAQLQNLEEGTDYTVTSTIDVKKGRGTLTFKGIGRFTGTVKKTFKVKPLNFDSKLVAVVCESSISSNSSSTAASADLGEFTYTKGGVKPEIKLVFEGKELTLNSDYKVKYSNNNAVNGKKKPTITIKGAGNFKGTFTRTFTIKGSSLADTTVTASDILANGKAGTCKPVIEVFDTNGEKLTAGKDYDSKNIEYTYAGDATILRKEGKNTSEVSVTEGDPVIVKKDIIPAGTEIMVTTHGKGLYDASSSYSCVFTYVDVTLNKATVKLNKSSYDYTGKKIEISESDLTVKIGKTTVPKGAYRITSISQNTGKGTAKVTITGTGLYGGKYYGGTKTATFKITAKKIN